MKGSSDPLTDRKYLSGSRMTCIECFKLSMMRAPILQVLFLSETIRERPVPGLKFSDNCIHTAEVKFWFQ